MIFKNPKPILGFDDRILVLLGIFLNTHTVMAIYYTSAFFKVPFKIYIGRWSGELLAVVVLWLVIRWLYLKLLKKSPGLKNQRKRFFIIPLLLIPYFLIALFWIYNVQPFFDWNIEEFPEPLVPVRIITGMVMFFVDIGVYEALHLLIELKDSRIKEEKLRKEKITAEMMILKNQMDPHFLFNSLNALLYLIDTDTEKAKAYVYKLSQVYQTLMKNNDLSFVTIKEEIENTKIYAELLNERFSENLKIDFKIGKEHHEKLIVPFSLQIGVENAIKHNVISNKRPLNIQIFADNDYIFVENDLQLKTQDSKSDGVGLKNIAERYQILSDKEIIIEESKDCFILKLPLLRSQINKSHETLNIYS